MRAFLEESKQAGLAAMRLHSLEGIIFGDQAQMEQEAGDYTGAERDYRKSVELGDTDCLKCLAEMLADEGKYADAIPIYTKYLALYPRNADALVSRSFAYMQIGKAAEGIDDLRAAAEAGSAHAQSELGRYYMIGVPGVLSTDPAAGITWFKRSAAQGFSTGQENLELARKMFGDQAVR
jgi:TPR repeat protein